MGLTTASIRPIELELVRPHPAFSLGLSYPSPHAVRLNMHFWTPFSSIVFTSTTLCICHGRLYVTQSTLADSISPLTSGTSSQARKSNTTRDTAYLSAISAFIVDECSLRGELLGVATATRDRSASEPFYTDLIAASNHHHEETMTTASTCDNGAAAW
ncbi:hypothetical protein KCV07_g459, partial [Aureobasidium melanogenum]